MEMTPTVVGVGTGLIDQYLENNDVSRGRVETMKQYATWFEIGAVIVGNFGANLGLGKQSQYTDPLAVAGATILGKKIYQAARATTPAAANVQQLANMVAARRWGARVGESTQPEFEGRRSF